MIEPNTTYLLAVRGGRAETRRFRAQLGAFLADQARAGVIRDSYLAELHVMVGDEAAADGAARLTLEAPVEAAA